MRIASTTSSALAAVGPDSEVVSRSASSLLAQVHGDFGFGQCDAICERVTSMIFGRIFPIAGFLNFASAFAP